MNRMPVHPVVCEDDQNRQRAGVDFRLDVPLPPVDEPVTFSIKVVGQRSNFFATDWPLSLLSSRGNWGSNHLSSLFHLHSNQLITAGRTKLHFHMKMKLCHESPDVQ